MILFIFRNVSRYSYEMIDVTTPSLTCITNGQYLHIGNVYQDMMTDTGSNPNASDVSKVRMVMRVNLWYWGFS